MKKTKQIAFYLEEDLADALAIASRQIMEIERARSQQHLPTISTTAVTPTVQFIIGVSRQNKP